MDLTAIALIIVQSHKHACLTAIQTPLNNHHQEAFLCLEPKWTSALITNVKPFLFY
jgi:hypothetical protein